MNRPTQALLVVMAAFLFLGPQIAKTEEPEEVQGDKRAKAPVSESTNRSGMRAYIDPETGELVGYRPPDRADVQVSERLRQALSRSDEGLESVTLPDGSVRVDLQGRFRHLNAARLDAGHELHTICVDHFSHLLEFIAPANSASEAGEEQ